MLPLGLRVQDKLERLIDKHMRTVGMLTIRPLQSLSSFLLSGSRQGHLRCHYHLYPPRSFGSSLGVSKRARKYEIRCLCINVYLRLSQIFRFQDRKESRFLLAPTHEEEITTLVGHLTKSYRDLPVRVYQICK